MSVPSRIVLATGNAHKAEELRAILSPLLPGVVFVGLTDLGLPASPPDDIEDHPDFAGNALAKAHWSFQVSGLRSIADDSGLVVDALDGRPGVRSRRWAGPTDQDRIDHLLAELSRVGAVDQEQRQARFVCASAFVWNEMSLVAQGVLEGSILDSPRGEAGFGYDPIFLLPQYGKTVSEMGPEIKNLISHRAVAMQALAAKITAELSIN